MKLNYLLLALARAQSQEENERMDERLVMFGRLPKVFNWYNILIDKFIPAKKAGKYKHRVGQVAQRIEWEINRCEMAGPEANKNDNQRGVDELLESFKGDYEDLDSLFNDPDFLAKVVDEFEYEDDDILETPYEDTERRVSWNTAGKGKKKKGKGKKKKGSGKGNRPTSNNKKPGKDAEWKATSQVKNDELQTVGRPPRVLLYRVNKTILKWFNNYMPQECLKYTRIFKRLKGLKMQMTKLMPTHEYVFEEDTSMLEEAKK